MIQVEIPPARGAADEGRTGEGAQARDGAETEGSRDAHASALLYGRASNPSPTILRQSTPHLQLGPDVAYDLIGKLGRARRTTEVSGLHTVEDGLESRLVDGA